MVALQMGARTGPRGALVAVNRNAGGVI